MMPLAARLHLQLVTDGACTMSTADSAIESSGGALESPRLVVYLPRGRAPFSLACRLRPEAATRVDLFGRLDSDPLRRRLSPEWFVAVDRPPLLSAAAVRRIVHLVVPLSSILAGVALAGRLRTSRWLALLLLIAGHAFFQARLVSDGVGYYAYLRSTVLDADLDFTNDYAMRGSGVHDERILLDRSTPRTATGRPPNYWSVGPAIYWAPAFLAAHAWALVLGPRYGVAPDGLSVVYAAPVCLSTAAMGFATLGVIGGCLERLGARRPAFTLAVTFFGTPLFFYTILNTGFPHVPSTLFATLFLLAWSRPDVRRRRSILAVSYALCVVTYWQLALLALVPAVTCAWHLATRRPGAARDQALDVLVLAAALGVAIVPQALAWKAITGHFLTVPQGSGFLRGRPLRNTVVSLVSPYHGLLTWTPLMALAVPALSRKARSERVAVASLAALAILFLHNATLWDWSGAGGFALRRLTPASLGIAIGLASLLGNSGARRVLAGLLAAWTSALALGARAGAFVSWRPPEWFSFVPQNYPRLPVDVARALTESLPSLAFSPPRLVASAIPDGPGAVAMAWGLTMAGGIACVASLAAGERLGRRLGGPAPAPGSPPCAPDGGVHASGDRYHEAVTLAEAT
ncbi:MAG: hypothetical protein U0166_14485 [Acidobacteriota bacterium]